MGDCAVIRPRHQNQLRRRFGGKHGGVNCTACAAAMVADAVLCRATPMIRGKRVRRLSSEPTPDERFPGLNLRQVTEALDAITDGRVVLTVRQPISWDRLRARLERGQVAVLQVQRGALNDLGFDFGRPFRGPHAVAIGFDRGKLWVDDPLTRKYRPEWDQLAEGAARLRLGAGTTVGEGFAWAAFGHRSAELPGDHRIEIRPGPVFLYTLRNGRIFDRRQRQVVEVIQEASSEPTTFRSDPGGKRRGKPPQTLVVITSGPLRGFGVRETQRVTITPPDAGTPAGPAPADPVFVRTEVTSADLPEALDGLEAADPADLPALELETDAETEGVKNEDVGEPVLAI